MKTQFPERNGTTVSSLVGIYFDLRPSLPAPSPLISPRCNEQPKSMHIKTRVSAHLLQAWMLALGLQAQAQYAYTTLDDPLGVSVRMFNCAMFAQEKRHIPGPKEVSERWWRETKGVRWTTGPTD